MKAHWKNNIETNWKTPTDEEAEHCDSLRAYACLSLLHDPGRQVRLPKTRIAAQKQQVGVFGLQELL